jgi:cytochrome c oxidase subunit II
VTGVTAVTLRRLAVAPSLALAGCRFHPAQSALDAAGPQAARIEGLWWLAFWIATAVWVVTIGALLYAAVHRRHPAPLAAPRDDVTGVPATYLVTPPERERRLLPWVAGATGLTVGILFAFLVADLLASRAIGEQQQKPAMLVKVTGYQWWWRVEYVDTNPSRTVVTANELHIPVGRPVQIELVSGDVIHSFWVPALHGKRDLVPGLKNKLYLQADRPGIYRGECAEFCGHQHAKMAFLVIAEAPGQFASWYEGQLREASPPTDSVRAKGLATFEGKSCAMCHQIRGTRTGGQVGPDLTHLASRRTIAAGSLPNTRGHLGGWIIDPQSLKPGTRMPPNNLTSSELNSLLAYLEGLQ